MNHRTLVASLAILGLGLVVVPDAASARAGGGAVGGGRAVVSGGIHRVVPRMMVRPRPLVNPRLSPHPFVNAGRHIGRHAPFRHHARRHHRDRFDDQPTVNVVPSSDDWSGPSYGVGPMTDPSVTGALPQSRDQDANADLAMARSCKATTTMVPSETRGGMVPITVTRCRPLDE